KPPSGSVDHVGMQPPRFIIPALLAGIAAVVTAACGATGATEPQHTTAAAVPRIAASEAVPNRLFAPSSFWNQPLATDAPVDPRSTQLVSALTSQVAAEEH